MVNVHIPPPLDATHKLHLMQEDARFEVGSDADAEALSSLPTAADPANAAVNAAAKIRSAPPPPTATKLMLAGRCIFNCAYCGCRCGRDGRQDYLVTPSELAHLAKATAEKSGIGVFLTSAIHQNADYTQELLAESARILRQDLGYRGDLHVKVMPGADPMLIARSGQYASRLSVNIEVAQSSGYARIAKQKTRQNILTPMGDIARQITAAKAEHRPFAVSQTTQLMAGSTQEDDRRILTLSAALYRKYRLKRVYYTPFHYENDAAGYETEHLPHVVTPRWRMARLYQADRLLQLYNFTPDDIAPADDPFLHEDIDPKAAWALRNMDLFPMEVNTADFDMLIRVPGIGITGAKRILEARRYCTLTHDVLRQMHIQVNRCNCFIVCNGRYQGGISLDSPTLTRLHLALA